MLNGIALIILSIIAIPRQLVLKIPIVRELSDKMEPYRKRIGPAFFFWGMFGVISNMLHLIREFRHTDLWWLTWMAGGIIQALLGFLLGHETIAGFLFLNDEAAKAKAGRLAATIAPAQAKLCVLGLIVGVWAVAAGLLRLW